MYVIKQIIVLVFKHPMKDSFGFETYSPVVCSHVVFKIKSIHLGCSDPITFIFCRRHR